ncbi:hypothetical protein K443DRAFT_670802 [Laccaria amethystina LaAM-08-1]|uniref:Unplaced genomic scaffold K443scaffold_1, whole genome shotgun sequence n=1 Tax=Laccaria amethystina LaAM-08-1 TaxID=1095629 RepID=A0A0C9XD37_9AGAR|nr:hypothetical protein K443DRAFT_670802 [Laccaria amethystina LaAM-08-1]
MRRRFRDLKLILAISRLCGIGAFKRHKPHFLLHTPPIRVQSPGKLTYCSYSLKKLEEAASRLFRR